MDEFKSKLDVLNTNISDVNNKLYDIEQKTEATWIKMLCIITDLIQYTNKHWEHDYIKPMFEDIIVPTVIEKRPLVRAKGLKAFSLFLQMDKTNTKNNLILFLHILAGDGPASEYFALQALFDFLMIFDLFDDEENNNNNNNNNNNAKKKKKKRRKSNSTQKDKKKKEKTKKKNC
eukprot:307115_1